jgi:hypothetical protein
MRTWLREAAIIAAAGTVLAGPLAAGVLALAPGAWRGSRLAWATLAACLTLVALMRRRRWRRP